jgi:hypothetical protein
MILSVQKGALVSNWIWGVAAIIVIVKIIWYCTNRIHPHRYEYLSEMSYTVWKEGRIIRIGLGKKHRGWISRAEFYAQMSRLEKEGLIDRRGDRTRSYKLTEGGIRKNHEVRHPVSSGVGITVVGG